MKKVSEQLHFGLSINTEPILSLWALNTLIYDTKNKENVFPRLFAKSMHSVFSDMFHAI